MVKRSFLIFIVLISRSILAYAQFCGTDGAAQKLLVQHPELVSTIEANERSMNDQVERILKNARRSALSKTTSTYGVDTFTIPVVVHVVHDYSAVLFGGTTYQSDVPDSLVYRMIDSLNMYYNAGNTNLSSVIAPFQKYIGNMHITFKLATKDPSGAATKGITHRVSYLTNGGDDFAKFDLWPPSSYLNIWIDKTLGLNGFSTGPTSDISAYSELPSTGAADPLVDGVTMTSPGVGYANESFLIAHEVGHYLGLLHPFGNGSGCPSSGCGDDSVDDTPPTTGEFCVSCAVGLYDTMCATGYFKLYPVDSISTVTHQFTGITRDSLVDYPDTANTQNIMTFSQCDPELMFTIGQAARVHAVLNTTVANRDSLWQLANLARTGALDAVPAMPPNADFLIGNAISSNTISTGTFVCPGTPVRFTNFSWNDTLASCSWVLPPYASTPASSSTTSFTSTFSQPGWVTVSLTATGIHNHGSTMRIDSTSLYVADINNPTDPTGYYQEFDPASSNDLGKYPLFNYYKNGFKWKVNDSVGYFDNSSMQYVGYDSRVYPETAVGLPKGDVDDMYTPVFDLTKLNGGSAQPSLNFMYAAAGLSSVTQDMNDTLEIDYNVGCSAVWTTMATLSKAALINNVSTNVAFRPTAASQWGLKSIQLPSAAVTSTTVFRFRYKPGVNFGYYTNIAGGFSTGNNFYMDRLNFSNDLGLNTLLPDDKSIIVAPNPTKADAFVLIGTKDNVTARVQVTDISGRVLYTTAQQTSGTVTRIAIPKSAIPVAGIYLVYVTAGSKVQTEKLVVY